jgi:hypothetical protein
MRRRRRLSLLFFIGVLAAGSTALGYYYYFFYEPPFAAGEAFMKAMEAGDAAALTNLVTMTPDSNLEELREPTGEDIDELLKIPFHRGRILDQRKRGGPSRDYHYLVYREPDGQIYALLVTKVGEAYKVVIPKRRHNPLAPYLWEYTWTN